MAWEDTAEAWITLGSGCIALLVAILAYQTAPRSAAHRTLALVLFVEGGLWLIPQGLVSLLGMDGNISPAAWGFYVSNMLAWTSVGWLYILFGIYGVEWTPLHRLRRPWVIAAVLAGLAGGLALQTVNAHAQLDGRSLTFAGFPVFGLPDVVKGASSLGVLIVVALSIRERRRASEDETRAWALLLAFGVRDVVWVVFVLVWYFPGFWAVGNGVPATIARLILFSSYGIYAFLVGRALLQGRILDVGHRIHIVVQRGTIAAIFVAVIVATVEIGGEFVGSRFGLGAAAVATVLMVLALGPMQQMAQNVADRAVPQARQGLHMSAAEQETFYAEQARIAYSDGRFGPKERQVLQSIRQRLGLSAERALAIEADLM